MQGHETPAVRTMIDTTSNDEKTKASEERLKAQPSPNLEQDGDKRCSPDTSTSPTQILDPASEDLESTTIAPKKPISIARSRRRGLFASLTIFAEVDDPYLYPDRAKWFITFIVTFAAAATSLGSAIIYRKFFE